MRTIRRPKGEAAKIFRLIVGDALSVRTKFSSEISPSLRLRGDETNKLVAENVDRKDEDVDEDTNEEDVDEQEENDEDAKERVSSLPDCIFGERNF